MQHLALATPCLGDTGAEWHVAPCVWSTTPSAEPCDADEAEGTPPTSVAASALGRIGRPPFSDASTHLEHHRIDLNVTLPKLTLVASQCKPYVVFMITSGAIQGTDPTSSARVRTCSSSRVVLQPKSAIATRPSERTRRLAALRSRWSTGHAKPCKYSTPLIRSLVRMRPGGFCPILPPHDAAPLGASRALDRTLRAHSRLESPAAPQDRRPPNCQHDSGEKRRPSEQLYEVGKSPRHPRHGPRMAVQKDMKAGVEREVHDVNFGRRGGVNVVARTRAVKAPDADERRGQGRSNSLPPHATLAPRWRLHHTG